MIESTTTLRDSKLMRALLALALALCLGAGSAALAGCTANDGQSAPAAADAISVSIAVNDGDAALLEPTTFDAMAEGATVLDVLESCPVDVVVEDSEYGAYVTSIGGVAADATHGWTYMVNDQQPTESAGSLKVSDGDSIVWNYIEFTPEAA